MEALPQEIIDQIASWLPEPGLEPQHGDYTPDPCTRPDFAVVSKKFQIAMERLTFRNISIRSNEISTFRNVFSTAHRRGIIANLEYTIVLPTYSEAQCAAYETAKDRRDNSRAAKKGMKRLLNVLAQWQPRQDLTLALVIESPMDPSASYDRVEPDIFHQRWGYSYVKIPNAATMPLAPCVRRVKMPFREQGRHFDPETTFDIATRFPRAQELWIHWTEPFQFSDFREMHRRDLVESLRSFRFPSSTQRLVLNVEPPELPSAKLPRIVVEDNDVLCSTVHFATENLSHLHFTGDVDPSLFWPYGPGTPPPFWQSMRSINVTMGMHAHSGEWYFRNHYWDWSNSIVDDSPELRLPDEIAGLPPPGHGTDEETSTASSYLKSHYAGEEIIWEMAMEAVDDGDFGDDVAGSESHEYCAVNEAAFGAVIKALTKAMAQMRSLQFVRLGCRGSNVPVVEFYAPGTPSKTDLERKAAVSNGGRSATDLPRLFIPKSVWIPGDEVLGMFQTVAKQRFNMEALVCFVGGRDMRQDPLDDC